MKHMRVYFLVLVCSFIFLNKAKAQHYNHFTFWSRVIVQKEISKKFQIQGEYHYRTQNDYHDATPNIFSESYFSGARLMFTYKHNTMSYSFAPFYISSNILAAKPADDLAQTRKEFRPTFFVEKKIAIKKASFNIRAGYEYRMIFKNDDFTPSGRLRTRFLLNYPIKNKSSIIFSEEPMINITPNASDNIFNQNQLYAGYNYKLSSVFDLEIGSMFSHRQRNNTTEFDEELGLNLAIRAKL
ncbi:MAG: DUF2490 domain-containing protein [Pseudarcicella sp.]|nr:DUF2490 domain-containing protein [Pseudarcicella sp.]MBP6410030.1 DUF2490 domain-containing protein [Pseudarcicella sp.]